MDVGLAFYFEIIILIPAFLIHFLSMHLIFCGAPHRDCSEGHQLVVAERVG